MMPCRHRANAGYLPARVCGFHRGSVIVKAAECRYGREAGVFEAADIREWRGHDVVDADGHKIGELEAVYVDTGTDLPSFGTVKVGLVGRHGVALAPLYRGMVVPRYLRASCGKKQVKDAPSIDTDGELVAAEEEAVFKHYGLT